MRIVIEKPITWLKSKRDGVRNQLMYNTLTNAVKALNGTYVEEPTYYGSDFVARSAPDRGLRLSYHSVGNTKNVWRIKETPIPYYFGIDRLGYSGWSELSVCSVLHDGGMRRQDEVAANAFCSELTNWLKDNNLSKYRQPVKKSVLPNRFVFLPMQVASDAVAQHNRLDPIAVLRRAADYAKSYGLPLVVKRHPYCQNLRIAMWLKWLAQTNPYIYLTGASVTRLLPACSAVLVGNSGVGLEALAYGKPVYAFAASEYDLVAYPIQCLEELELIFSVSQHARHPDSYRFVRYYLLECCFDSRNADDAREKVARILRDVAAERWLSCGERLAR